MSAPAQQPSTLDEALGVIAQQQAEIVRLQTAHEAWMRAVAHDLRAPLRHVVSFAPLLKESVQELAVAAPHAVEAAEDAQEFAAAMEQSARKMSAMLDGMALVSRAARMPLHVEAVDAAALIQSLVRTLQEPHPHVQWNLPVQPVWVQADAQGLRLLLQALIDNAIKFSARQVQPHIAIHARQSGDVVRLEIKDNGVGFEDARAQALGELFQRMHRDSEFEGVGCGLALVSTLVQRHGAHWGVQSQPQAGCTVHLEWPAPAQ
jgi:signal transduction histidine kinase